MNKVDYISQIEEDGFVQSLEETTLNCENISKDFSKSCDRLMKFIKKEILNIEF